MCVWWMVMVIDLAASHSPFYLFPLSSSSPKVHIHRNIGWFQTDRERERESMRERRKMIKGQAQNLYKRVTKKKISDREREWLVKWWDYYIVVGDPLDMCALSVLHSTCCSSCVNKTPTIHFCTFVFFLSTIKSGYVHLTSIILANYIIIVI